MFTCESRFLRRILACVTRSSLASPGIMLAALFFTVSLSTPVSACGPPPTYSLALSFSGSGSVYLSPYNQSYSSTTTQAYSAGTVVSLAATPAAGYRFDHWSGDIQGQSSSASITMNSNKSVTATFVPEQFTLTTYTQGTGSVSPASGTYNYGTTVSITATPGAGYQFSQWSGDLSGSTNPASLTMNSNKSVTATFILQTVTLTSSVQGSGTVSPASGTFNYLSTISVSATPGSGYLFDHWNGSLSGTTNPASLYMNGNKNVIAYFVAAYNLTTTVTGTGSVSPSGGTYPSGTTVSLSASPAANWRFSGWSGALTGATNPASLQMTSDKTVNAAFVRQYTLTATNQGSGTVTPSSGTYDSGASVTLTATASSGWRFSQWSGALSGSTNPATLTMDSDKTVTAVFVQQYRLTTAVQGGGSVSPATGLYDAGTVVNVSATPSADWRFKTWQGPVANATSASTTVTMNSDCSVTAVCTQEYRLTATVASGQGTVSPTTAWCARNSDATVTASPSSGWAFDSWTGPVANTNRATTTVHMDGDKTVSATFGTAATLIVTLTPPNGTLRLNPGGKNNPDGVFNSNQATDVYPTGKSVEITVVLADGYEIDHWQSPLSGADNPKTVVVAGNTSVTGELAPINYLLTTSAAPASGGSVSPTTGPERRNTSVSCTATPQTNWRFVNWSGALSGSANPQSVSMTSPRTVTANFVETSKVLLTTGHEGQGATTPAAQSYNPQETAQVSATPADNWRFAMWKGGPIDGSSANPEQFTISADTHCTGIFVQTGQFYLSVSKDGEGEVTGAGPYASGATATATATPAPNWRFVHWEGDDVNGSTNSTVQLVMNNDKRIKAIFAPDGKFHLTVSIKGQGTVTPMGGNYDPGAVVSLQASAASGWVFQVWRGAEIDGQTFTSASVTMNADKSVTAEFDEEVTGGGSGDDNTQDLEPEGDHHTCNDSPFKDLDRVETPDSDPVRPFSGEVYLEVEDLRIRGRGMDFVWKRTYRSKTGSPTELGNNWDFSYNMYVTWITPTSMASTVKGKFGGISRVGTSIQGLDFKTGLNVWGMDGVSGYLAMNQDRSFNWYTPEGSVYHYYPYNRERRGKLESITDRNGNRILFGYDAQARLTSVTDTLGRTISVSYDSYGHIQYIQDFTGRRVTYTYYGTNEPGGCPGDLKSVTTPPVTGTPNGNNFLNGKTTVYTYTTGSSDDILNHNLQSITSPNGETYVVNSYYPTTDPADINYDRVSRQYWGGHSTDFVYAPQTPSTDNGNAVITAIVRDRNANVREYSYDNKNREVLYRAYTGKAPDATAPTTESMNRPTGKLRDTDPDYYEKRYTWNRDSLLSGVQFFAGNQKLYATDNVYQHDNQTNFVVASNILGAGNCLGRQAEVKTSSGTTPINHTVLYTYTTLPFGCSGCSGAFVRTVQRPNGPTITKDYDNHGNLTRITYPVTDMVEDFEYNQYGQLTSHTLPDNGSGHRRRDEYAYSTVGGTSGYLQSITLDKNGLNLTATVTRDALGAVTSVTDARGNTTYYTYNQLGQVVQQQSRTVSGQMRLTKNIYYDANNNVVRTDVHNLDEIGAARGDGWLTVTYAYDALNFLTEVAREAGNGVTAITQFEYDANRNLSLIRTPEAVAGNQPGAVIQIVNDERDLPWRIVQAPQTPQQLTTQLDYDGTKNVINRTIGLEGAPRTYTYQYDGLSQLESATDPLGTHAEFQYNAEGNLILERLIGSLQQGVNAASTRLRETAYDYDDVGRLTAVARDFFDPITQDPISDGSSLTTLTYTPASRLSAVTDDRNHTMTLLYDNANRLQQVVDALGNTRAYTYDANGNITSTTATHKPDPAVGGPDQTITVTSTYDGLDRPLTQTDGSGNQSHFAYDSLNNLVAVTDPAGAVTRFDYDTLGRLVRTRRLLTPGSSGSEQWIDTTASYDLNSRQVAATDANSALTEYAYDAGDRLTSITYPDGTQETFTYNLFGDLASSSDANGTVVTNTYDALSRLTSRSVTAAAGVYADTTWETFTYDGLSRIITANNNAATTEFHYDSLSNIVQETLNGATVAHTYDGMSNPVSTQYPGGATINRVFDELNRVASLRRAGDTTDLAAYNYVGPDRILRRTQQNGTRLSLAYDGITGVPNPSGDHGFLDPIRTTHTRTTDNVTLVDTAYLWDAHGNKVANNDLVGGSELSLAYDLTGRMTSWTNSGTGLYQNETFSLDDAGNRSYTGGNLPDLGAYTQVDSAPEPADAQVNQYTTTPLYNQTYDAAGNLLASHAKTPSTWSSQAHTNIDYHYDYQNRPVAFTSERRGAQVFSDTFNDYDYDGWTVRSGAWGMFFTSIVQTSQTGGAIAHPQPKNDVSAQFTYFAVSGQPPHAAHFDVRNVSGGPNDGDTLRVSFTTDTITVSQRVAGSWTTLGACSISTPPSTNYLLRVQAWGRHVRVWHGLAGAEPALLLDLANVTQYGSTDLAVTDEGASTYVFDNFDVREYSQTSGTYAYDALGRRIRSDIDATGGRVTNYLFNGWQTVQERDATGAVQAEYFHGQGLDDPIAMRRGGQDYFYHADELGNVLALSNAAGQVVERYTYGPYGAPSVFDGAGTPLAASATGNPLLFNAREYDPAMRLYNYRMRWLDPQAGRFTTRDPLGAFYDPWAAGNPYTYVGNSPWDNTDPLGLLRHNGRVSIDEKLATDPAHAPIPGSGIEGYSGLVIGNPFWHDIERNLDVMHTMACDNAFSDLLDSLQQALDTAGLVPVAGEPFDGLSAILSGLRGDKVGLALSLAAMVPLAGDAAGAAKIARKTDALKNLTGNNFRHNLKGFTGLSGVDIQAHHFFSQQFEDIFFFKYGINIHSPRYGTWWDSASHSKNWYEYNQLWKEFLDTNPSYTQVKDFARWLAEKYDLPIYF